MTMLTWTTPITVLNRYKEDDKLCWKRTYLDSCFWGKSREYTLRGGYETDLTLHSVVRIPVSPDYVEPHEFAGTGFTLAPGDIVAKGHVDWVVPDNSDGQEYVTGDVFVLKHTKNNDHSGLSITRHYWGSD